MEFLCFLHDPTNVGNLISGFSALSKPSFQIWKFSFHILLRPCLKNNLTSMQNEHSCPIIWTFFSTAVLCYWDENWPFPVLWPLLSFPNLLAYGMQNFNSIIFQDLKQLSWNSITPPLALFIVMLPKAHLTSHSRMSGSRWVTIPSWLSQSLRPFFVQFFCVFLPALLNLFCLC